MTLRLTLTITVVLITQTCFAQLFGAEQIISSQVAGAKTVFPADLDNDGDLDVISAGANGGSDWINWNENLGGGQFGPKQLISTLPENTYCIHAGDMDNDGDMDVLSASIYDGRIGLFENLGVGLFDTLQTLTDDLGSATFVSAADLEGDGDLDVLWATQSNSSVGWIENLGGNQFSSITALSGGSTWAAKCVRAADIDGDGDMDVLSASSSDDKIAWYENLGGLVFGSQQIISNQADGARSVYFADLDQDSDLDVLSASVDDNKIAWYENLGDGLFGTEQIITLDAIAAWSVYSADLDLDGDMDVLSASFNGNKLSWYENLGSGDFGIQQVIFSPAWSAMCITAADLDDDGDMDVLAAIAGSHKVSWFENLAGEGCLDAGACNYDPNAWINDGSCCYGICGCTNPLATNYLETANCDIGNCEFRVTGTVFYDDNQNGIMDGMDYGLPFLTVVMEENGQSYITNDQGNFVAILNQQQIATFDLFNPVTFPTNTTPSPQSFNANTSASTQLMFGVHELNPAFGLGVDVYPSGFTFLCNEYTNFNICFRNLGNVPVDGVVELQYDPLFQGYQEVTPIDSVIGNSVYMSFENLLPGQMFFYDVVLLTPTVDHIGEYITNIAKVYAYYEGNQEAYAERVRTMEITCAYDPNDKQAFPQGYTDQHLLLQETQQEFLIRFQNTGNATAQNIRIQDTLDVNFDMESFRFIANSHSVMTTIDPETRLIDFYFENIQLPDSGSNEPASHGLISYMITPLPDLPVGTVLENTAFIYFDNNDPIITNTTWTTIHECGGESAFDANTAVICGEQQVNFESTYEFVEEYSWQVDGVEVGVNPSLLLSSIDNPEYEVTLTASNPLCTETSTLNYEVPDITSIDPCRADFNCDGNRDTEDLLIFMGEFGCLNTCAADLDSNAIVNVADLFILVSVFDQSCWE